ncbi:hypothetical protein ANN_15639 [Periplaneta americana]|uniref:Uncharacterized protein n=1 Tax=Periplaneta americana TaxID=6978 RepID=A0ABQ8SIU6_PERAM|nr:hypothetical protein ANN_15639 [Periplaneta americana]
MRRDKVSKPMLLYDGESWILNKNEELRIEAAQMRVLKPLVGLTRRDCIRKDNIRQQHGIQNITEDITNTQKETKNCIHTIERNRRPKIALQYKPGGSRWIGQPRKRWIDQYF